MNNETHTVTLTAEQIKNIRYALGYAGMSVREEEEKRFLPLFIMFGNLLAK